jgi:hypothetical protein
MNGNIATPPTTSAVEVSAEVIDSSEIVSCEIPVQHQSGAPDGLILASAFSRLMQLGGILRDGEGGMDFYAISKLKAPVKLRVKKILMIGS